MRKYQASSIVPVRPSVLTLASVIAPLGNLYWFFGGLKRLLNSRLKFLALLNWMLVTWKTHMCDGTDFQTLTYRRLRIFNVKAYGSRVTHRSVLNVLCIFDNVLCRIRFLSVKKAKIKLQPLLGTTFLSSGDGADSPVILLDFYFRPSNTGDILPRNTLCTEDRRFHTPSMQIFACQ